MAKLISKTYGEALFSLAVDEAKVDDFEQEIEVIIQVLHENPDFQKLMNHPKISKEEKIQVIHTVFEKRISEELVGFLTIIVSKERYNELDAILEYFQTEVKAMKGIGVAYVTTVIELNENQKKQVVTKLLETTNYNQMEMHYAINKNLIGGMVIRIGDRVVDSSVKTKLEKLESQLLKIQLA